MLVENKHILHTVVSEVWSLKDNSFVYIQKRLTRQVKYTVINPIHYLKISFLSLIN